MLMLCEFRLWAPFGLVDWWTGGLADWRTGGLADWLVDWLRGTNSFDLMCKCFLDCLELNTPIANMAAKMRVLKVK